MAAELSLSAEDSSNIEAEVHLLGLDNTSELLAATMNLLQPPLQ